MVIGGQWIYTAVWQGLEISSPFMTSIGCGASYQDSLSDGIRAWLGLARYLGGNLLDNGFRWLFLRYRYQRYMSLKG